MKTIITTTAIFMMMIVITKETILQAVPIGTTEQEMLAYFDSLEGDITVGYYTRENAVVGTVSHELQEGEAGYYIVTLRGVRDSWWKPSMGRVLIPIIIVSDEGRVSEIKFFGGRTGWP